jgi:hypothetical protein
VCDSHWICSYFRFVTAHETAEGRAAVAAVVTKKRKEIPAADIAIPTLARDVEPKMFSTSEQGAFDFPVETDPSSERIVLVVTVRGLEDVAVPGQKPKKARRAGREKVGAECPMLQFPQYHNPLNAARALVPRA